MLSDTTGQSGRLVFRLDTLLGAGAFGEVYRAVMRSPSGIEQVVAVKLLNRDLDPRGQPVARLRDEGKVLATLNHPTILRVHDMAVLDGRVALVTEYVEGEDLHWCIHDVSVPIPVRGVLQVVADVADALDTAWTASTHRGEPLRLVHRDIKPANIRITTRGTVKLLDFGIAKMRTGDRETTATKKLTLIGTPAYMAPEVLNFDVQEAMSSRDVYALGATVYEALTQTMFFDAVDDAEILRICRKEDRYEAFHRERIDALAGKGLDDALVALVSRMLDQDHEARPSAHELSGTARHLQDRLTGEQLWSWCRRVQWPPLPASDGGLTGKSIIDGTLITDGDIEGSGDSAQFAPPTYTAEDEAPSQAPPPVKAPPPPPELAGSMPNPAPGAPSHPTLGGAPPVDPSLPPGPTVAPAPAPLPTPSAPPVRTPAPVHAQPSLSDVPTTSEIIPRRPFPWAIVLVLLALLVGGGGIAAWFVLGPITIGEPLLADDPAPTEAPADDDAVAEAPEAPTAADADDAEADVASPPSRTSTPARSTPTRTTPARSTPAPTTSSEPAARTTTPAEPEPAVSAPVAAAVPTPEPTPEPEPETVDVVEDPAPPAASTPTTTAPPRVQPTVPRDEIATVELPAKPAAPPTVTSPSRTTFPRPTSPTTGGSTEAPTPVKLPTVPQAMVSVEILGTAKVQLRQGRRTWDLSTSSKVEVPAGPLEVWATFDDAKMTRQGRVEASADGRITVLCKAAVYLCRVTAR